MTVTRFITRIGWPIAEDNDRTSALSPLVIRLACQFHGPSSNARGRLPRSPSWSMQGSETFYDPLKSFTTVSGT